VISVTTPGHPRRYSGGMRPHMLARRHFLRTGLALAGLGVAGHWGGWYGGLSSIPAFNPAAAPDPDLAEATRNNALATAVALLLGLVGSVIGGWMASGEPMTFTHHRKRDRLVDVRATTSSPR